MAATAKPDGYTIGSLSSSSYLIAAQGRKLPYDPVNDYETIGEIGDASQILIINRSLSIESLKEFAE